MNDLVMKNQTGGGCCDPADDVDCCDPADGGGCCDPSDEGGCC